MFTVYTLTMYFITIPAIDKPERPILRNSSAPAAGGLHEAE